MKVILSHPLGNANVRAAAKGMVDAGILHQFNTALASFPGSILDRFGSIPMFSEFKRRSFDASLRLYTNMRPLRELGRQAANKGGLTNFTRHESGYFSLDAVYRDLDAHIAKKLKQAVVKGASAVYNYDDGAASTFAAAKQYNLHCLYDLPTGYWRAAQRMLEREKSIWPEWVSTMPGFQDSTQKLERKDTELKLADKIYVASRFTANTLKDFPGDLAPIEVIPYGFPAVVGKKDYSKYKGKHILKLLFVGQLSHQKGLAYLFEAVESMRNHVQLTIVGRKLTENCEVLNHELKKHRWVPSLPHDQILNIMRQHDVLVFPSLFDGFGLVITEAMAQGTPVITTYATAGPDIIEHGKNGWLVEAGSSEALRLALEKIILDPKLIAEVGRQAMHTAILRPWEVYGSELAASLKQTEVDLLRLKGEPFGNHIQH